MMSKWRELIVTRLLSILRLPVTVSKVPGTSLATWSCSEVTTCTLPPPEWSPSQVEVRCISSCSLQEVTDHLARSHMGPCLSIQSSFFIGLFVDLSSQLNTLNDKNKINFYQWYCHLHTCLLEHSQALQRSWSLGAARTGHPPYCWW